jgi:hypothetical protein
MSYESRDAVISVVLLATGEEAITTNDLTVSQAKHALEKSGAVPVDGTWQPVPALSGEFPTWEVQQRWRVLEPPNPPQPYDFEHARLIVVADDG